MRIFCLSSNIVGLFPDDTLKLESEATLLVFPDGGGESRFDTDLSTIP